MRKGEEVIINIDGQDYTYKQLQAITGITIHGVRNRVRVYLAGRISGYEVFHKGRKPGGGFDNDHATDEWKALSTKPRKCTPVKVGTWEQQSLFHTGLYAEGKSNECRICEPNVARLFNG